MIVFTRRLRLIQKYLIFSYFILFWDLEIKFELIKTSSVSIPIPEFRILGAIPLPNRKGNITK
jgi:hypothetical protein